MNRLWSLHSNIKVRLIVTFITRLHSTSLVVLLPIFFKKITTSSITALIVGLVLAANIIGKFAGGWIGDRYNKKPILLWGNLIEIIIYACLFGLLFNKVQNLVLLSVLFFLNSFMASLKGPLLESLLLDVLIPENRKFVYSVSYWLSNLSMSLAFVIAGFIFNGQLYSVIIFGFACHLVSLFLLYRHIEDSSSTRVGKNRKRNNRSTAGYFIVLEDKRFLLFCAGFILIMAVESQFSNFIAIHFDQNFEQTIFSFYVDGIKLLSILQIINTSLVVIIPLLFPTLFDLNRKKVFSFGAIIYSVGYAGLVLTQNFYILVLLAVIFTIGEIFYYPFRQTLLAEIVNKENQTKYLAFNQIIIQIARLFGAVGIALFSGMNLLIVSCIILGMGLLGTYIINMVSKESEIEVDTKHNPHIT